MSQTRNSCMKILVKLNEAQTESCKKAELAKNIKNCQLTISPEALFGTDYSVNCGGIHSHTIFELKALKTKCDNATKDLFEQFEKCKNLPSYLL